MDNDQIIQLQAQVFNSLYQAFLLLVEIHFKIAPMAGDTRGTFGTIKGKGKGKGQNKGKGFGKSSSALNFSLLVNLS